MENVIKYEPAILEEECIGWLQINNQGFSEEVNVMPKNLDKINKYIMKRRYIKEFIKNIKQDNKVYLILNIINESKILTNIQKNLKVKQIVNDGFKESELIHGIFLKKVDKIDSLDDIIRRVRELSPMFIFSKEEFSEEKLIKILINIDFINQPRHTYEYIPRIEIVPTLINNFVSIMYLSTCSDIFHEDIFICYSPRTYNIL